MSLLVICTEAAAGTREGYDVMPRATTKPEERERVGKVRDFIASKLTPDQLAKAQELARNWQPKKLRLVL